MINIRFHHHLLVLSASSGAMVHLTTVLSLSVLLVAIIIIPASKQAGVRLLGKNNSTEGELQLLDLHEWTTLCAGSLEPIEAQIACRELGYPFFLQIGVIDNPAQDENIFSVTMMNCNFLLEMNVSPATLRLETCTYDLIFGDCTESVYLKCGRESMNDTDYGLVIFTGLRQFWLFTSNISNVIGCTSIQFYCEPSFWVTESIATMLLSEHVCEKIDVTTFPGIQCEPGEGDVCLQTTGGDDCTSQGAVRYVNYQNRLISVCALSFGFFEAHLVCSQLGLPRISSVSHIPLNEDIDKSTVSANCSGSGFDEKFTQCHFETVRSCHNIAFVQCDESTEKEPSVLIGVSIDSTVLFTVISPEDSVYVDDCQSTRPLYCPGVYYIERTLPTIQDLLTQLQDSQSCSQLEPIDLPIHCPVTVDTPSTTTNTCDVLRFNVAVDITLVMIALLLYI